MRIGIDIDGVLTDIERFVVDYVPKYCIENNIEYKIGESDYNICKTFNINKEQGNNFWDTYIEDYAKNEKARAFASEVIEKLKQEGNEIYIITARWDTNREDEKGSKMRETVKNWLCEYKIPYDKLVFSKAEQERKSDEIIENKIDLMIEDNPNNINELSKIIPVICYHAEYNKECKSDKITRCYSWYDIYRTISNEKQNFIFGKF